MIDGWRGVEQVISGGQTGVDRAALDVAMRLGIACGGWCPKGRRAEDGPIAPSYLLREASSARYPQRTRLNVRDADATLVLCAGPPTGGTALTVRLAKRMGKPVLVVDLEAGASPEEIRAWLGRIRPRILNVAGPRASESPGIYARAADLVRGVLAPSRGGGALRRSGGDLPTEG